MIIAWAMANIYVTFKTLQGCQIVYFQTKPPVLVPTFWKAFELKILLCFMSFWFIWWSIVTLSQCIPMYQENLATLVRSLAFVRKLLDGSEPGLPDFLGPNIPIWEKYTYQMTTNYMYQMDINFTKWPENIPNGHKVDKHFPF
jgi:hypothetical protein